MCLAIPGKIITEPEGPDRLAKVNFGGSKRDVYLSYLPEAKMGDYVLVHVGFALSIIDTEEAKKMLDDLKKIADVDEGIEEQ